MNVNRNIGYGKLGFNFNVGLRRPGWTAPGEILARPIDGMIDGFTECFNLHNRMAVSSAMVR